MTILSKEESSRRKADNLACVQPDTGYIDCYDTIDDRDKQIELARTYKGIEAQACPLCEYREGKFIKSCEMHKQIQNLRAKVEELERMLWVRRTAVLMLLHDKGCKLLERHPEGEDVKCTCGAVKEPEAVVENYVSKPNGTVCLHDSISNGDVAMIACTCPKCAPQC
jgi:hypothetical protein